MTDLHKQYALNQPVVEQAVAVLAKYGLVHSGLLINNVPVHWNNDGLVTFSNDPKYYLAYALLHVQKCSMEPSSINSLQQRIAKAKDDKELRVIVDSGFESAEKIS